MTPVRRAVVTTRPVSAQSTMPARPAPGAEKRGEELDTSAHSHLAATKIAARHRGNMARRAPVLRQRKEARAETAATTRQPPSRRPPRLATLANISTVSNLAKRRVAPRVAPRLAEPLSSSKPTAASKAAEEEAQQTAQKAELDRLLARAVELGITTSSNAGIIKRSVGDGDCTANIRMWSERIKAAEQAMGQGMTGDAVRTTQRVVTQKDRSSPVRPQRKEARAGVLSQSDQELAAQAKIAAVYRGRATRRTVMLTARKIKLLSLRTQSAMGVLTGTNVANITAVRQAACLPALCDWPWQDLSCRVQGCSSLRMSCSIPASPTADTSGERGQDAVGSAKAESRSGRAAHESRVKNANQEGEPRGTRQEGKGP